MCDKTISYLLRRNGITCHIASRQTKLTEDQKVYRVAFCQRMLENLDAEYYENIFFSDEKTFATDLRHQQLVYRAINARFNPEYVVEDNMSGRITAGYWGCIGVDGPVTNLVKINGNLITQKYIRILRNNLLPAMNNFNNQKVFMQDNSPIHKSKDSMAFLARQQFELLMWPANSPDLNPIENLWAQIIREWPRMQNRTQDALDAILQERWNALQNQPGNDQQLYFDRF